MSVFDIKNLTKTYNNGKVIANNNLNLTIEEGEVFGLLGPNGSGKTTLVKQMVGLLKPDNGSIKFYDKELTTSPEYITYFLGYMTQRIGALSDLYAREALEITGKLKGLSAVMAREQAKVLMREFNMDSYGSRPLNKLSGGQNRLVNFCASLMGSPKILILDEPTNDLDPQYRKFVWDKLLELNRKDGLTIILVTHNVIEAEKILERVALINHGVISAMGSVGYLKSKVSKQVKIELKFKPEFEDVKDQIMNEIAYPVVSQGERQWTIYVEEDKTQDIVKYIFENVGVAKLNDFRILTPTLEDVYLQLSGGGESDEVA
jgi:ABC-type multidrug transport system ATPase subunit